VLCDVNNALRSELTRMLNVGFLTLQVELPDDKKSFYFASDSDFDMDKWVNSLSEFAGIASE